MYEFLYNNVVWKVMVFLEFLGLGFKKDEISVKLDDVNKRWDEFKRKINDRYV